MALTPLRWIAIAVMGMLVASIIVIGGLELFDPRFRYFPTEDDYRLDSMYNTTTLHERRASVYARQYRMGQLADSLRRASMRDARNGAIRTSYGASLAPILRTAIDSAVAGGSEKIGSAPRIGVDLVALYDTTAIDGIHPWPWGEIPFYILPAQPGERCIVVIPFGKETYGQSTARTLGTDDARQQIFGPCAYFANFGVPGPRIREWLRGRGGLFALGGYWTKNVTPSEQDYFASYDPYFTPHPYYPIGPAAFTYYSNRAIDCLTGNGTACEDAVLRANTNWANWANWAPLGAGQALRVGFRLGPISWRDGAEFGGRETELLADMIRSLGRERFERFWTSGDSVSGAFRQAAGMPLGEWVSGWAAERVDPIKHGPTIPGATLFSGLGLAAVCILIAALAARRREFA